MRWRESAVLLPVGAFGVVSELVAAGWDRPSLWLPDLAVGLVFLGAALRVVRTAGAGAASPATGSAALLAAVAVTWFAGNLAWPVLYWHRGPLLHLLLAYPGWRVGGRLGVISVLLAYLAAIVTPVWHSEPASIVVSTAFLGVAILRHRAGTGRERRYRRVALLAMGSLAAVLVIGAIARLEIPASAAVQPALWAYQAVLCAVAVGTAAGLRRPPPAKVADLVVELGDTRSGTLRDALARALGDPALQVGYWLADTGRYVDPTGAPLPVPSTGAERLATFVQRDGGPFAVLVHDAAVLNDPVLVKAVADATRLTASHAALQAEVRAQLAQVTASRRRLLIAGDEERRRIEQRLHDGPRGRLVRLRDLIRSATPDGEAPESVQRAAGHLDRTLDDLHELARGLHPRELAGGLADALAALVERSPTTARLTTTSQRFPPEVEVTAYYTCAEALANVAKHAAASLVTVEVTRRDAWLRVAIVDNGTGGADPARGSGLTGLTDRIEALGGRLTVHSPPGAGTRLLADLPLATGH